MRREVKTLKYARQTLGKDVNNAVKKLDGIEQYSRRNCLIFIGIKEDSDRSMEDTDELVIDICNTKLGLNITEDSIDRSHRLGRWHPFTSQSQTESETPKPWAIIVKEHVKIIFIPVIALSFPHFRPKLKQTLHIHQGQHS